MEHAPDQSLLWRERCYRRAEAMHDARSANAAYISSIEVRSGILRSVLSTRKFPILRENSQHKSRKASSIMTILTNPSANGAVALQTQSIKAETLDLTAVINRITPTVAGVWDLNGTQEEVPKDTTSFTYKNPGSESVMENDGRTIVAPEHFSLGGKYRS